MQYKDSADGVLFQPTPSLHANLSLISPGAFGQAPTIAFFPPENRWYASINNIAGNDHDGMLRIGRGRTGGDLFTDWLSFLAMANTFQGEEINLLAGLARNANSTLYVDQDGWGYLFFTQGLLETGCNPSISHSKIS